MAKDNLFSELTSDLIKGSDSAVASATSFIESNWGFNIKLTPAQRVVVKCFYGIPLDDVDLFPIYDVVKDRIVGHFTEKTFMKWMYDNKRCNYPSVPEKPIKELVLVAGRRSGKTLVTSCILGYELYKLIKKGDPAKFYGKPEQQTIVVTNVAPTDEQAGLVYDFTVTAIEHCPIMKNRLHNKTQKYFSLFTDKDLQLGKNKASLEFITGGCSSTGLRGPDAIAVSMDEMAFFLTNESSKFSGSEVYGALTPSCKGFAGDGKVICISSPHARYGKFYDLYKQGMEEKDSSTLVFQMYTAMINPDRITSDDLKTERRRNRRKFIAEFGGEFSDTVNAWVDDPNEFDAIIDKNFNIPKRGKQDIRYYGGLDLAFTNDGTAVSIVHNENGIIVLDYSNVWFSGASDVWTQDNSIYQNCSKYKHLNVLTMEDIVKEIKEIDKWFPIKKLVFDQHNGQAFLERCRQNEVMFCEMINFNDTLNSEVYETTKRLYAEKLLKIWNHPVLVPELLMLESEMTGTGGYKYDVHAPKRVGCHDDISESWSRAVWTCYNDKHKNSKAPALGSYLSRDARYQALMNRYNSGNPRIPSNLGRSFYR